MKHLLILIVLAASGTTLAQSQEREVLALLNEVRSAPKRFLKNRLEPYLVAKDLTKNGYAKSLVKELKDLQAIGKLQTSVPLTEIARQHANDMGKNSLTGHDSSDGTPFHVRVREYTKAKGGIAENCAYGYEEPLDIVMSLLIDDGITSLGHRKNILSAKYKWVGVAIEPHQSYRTNCVMDFAEGF